MLGKRGKDERQDDNSEVKQEHGDENSLCSSAVEIGIMGLPVHGVPLGDSMLSVLFFGISIW